MTSPIYSNWIAHLNVRTKILNKNLVDLIPVNTKFNRIHLLNSRKK